MLQQPAAGRSKPINRIRRHGIEAEPQHISLGNAVDRAVVSVHNKHPVKVVLRHHFNQLLQGCGGAQGSREIARALVAGKKERVDATRIEIHVHSKQNCHRKFAANGGFEVGDRFVEPTKLISSLRHKIITNAIRYNCVQIQPNR